MALRCLLFSSDGGAAAPILQVLAGLGVEGELCSEAVTTVQKVTHQNFQIVIIDWDKQPEAGLLLTAARERKAAERPLTLALVSNDASVPQALQAGANSILRKPIMLTQVKDTLTTARDLLRSKQDSAATAAQAAAAAASASSTTTLPASVDAAKERTLRAGEFLQSAGSAPGGQFETDSDVHESLRPSSAEPVDLLKDLEPMAGSVTEQGPAPAAPPAAPPPHPGETRGLEWFLKSRAVQSPPAPASAPAPAAKLELLGFDQTPAPSPAPPKNWDDVARAAAPEAKPIPPSLQQDNHDDRHEERHEERHEQKQHQKHEQKKEAELFAYIAGESIESEQSARPRFRHKGAIIGALVLAGCAILAAPQAPWHPKITAGWVRGRQTVHAWLNPQLVTTPQAPVAHEDFGRAGDEYKLPVAENIPDATTDPSQIQVLPVVDPTVKKPNSLGANSLGANPDQPPVPGDASAATPGDPTPPAGTQPSSTPEATQPVSGPTAGATSTSPVPTPSTVPAVAVPAATGPPRSETPVVGPPATSTVSTVPAQPAPQKNPQPHYAPAPGHVPSSLKSQMASMTPDMSGNKAPEAAMQSIEPVAVPETAERALLTEQPALAYPATAKGQKGTVVLQVLIGRDGTVQDAKFLQGSLAFAHTAIDGARQWKFKPYVMNGRPVSVQTTLTIIFDPAP